MDFKTIIFALVVIFGVPMVTMGCLYSTKIRDWAITLMVFSLSLADKGNINFMSRALYRGYDRGFEIALTDILAWGIGLSLLVKFRNYKLFPANTLLMLLYFIAALVSVRNAPDPMLSYFTLFKMARAYILFAVCANIYRQNVSLEPLWKGLVAIAFYLGYHAFMQKYVGGLYRIRATFDHSNSVPLFLNQMLPVLMAMLFVHQGNLKKKLITVAASLAMLFTVVMTFSRAGMVLAVFTVLAVIFVANRRLKSNFVKIVTIAALCGIFLGGAMTAGSIIRRFKEAPESSALARAEFNAAAFKMAHDYTNGIGLNQFSGVLTNNPVYRSGLTVMGNETVAGVCHEVYLLTAAETGWIGMSLFILMIVGFLARQGWAAFRIKGGNGLIIFGFFAGALALALSGLLEWVFKTNPILNVYMVMSGISIGFIERSRNEARMAVVKNHVTVGLTSDVDSLISPSADLVSAVPHPAPDVTEFPPESEVPL